MGYELCALLCNCFSDDLVYDPFLCDSCVSFFKRSFVHATVESLFRTASDEVERHLRKLGRFASGLENGRHVKCFLSF